MMAHETIARKADQYGGYETSNQRRKVDIPRFFRSKVVRRETEQIGSRDGDHDDEGHGYTVYYEAIERDWAEDKEQWPVEHLPNRRFRLEDSAPGFEG